MQRYPRWQLFGMLIWLLLITQPAQAFFCFNFSFGNSHNERYRGLPRMSPNAAYAPHPSQYLSSSQRLSTQITAYPISYPRSVPPGQLPAVWAYPVQPQPAIPAYQMP